MHNGKGEFMKKNIYTGIFCTILGLCTNTTANASIVSSGFLDEKLTEMTNATALQLDTKANQRDLIFINTELDPAFWNDQRESAIKWSAYSVAPIIAELFPDFVDEPYVPDSISGTLLYSLSRIEMPGIAGFTNKLLNGWTDENGLLANPGLKNIYWGWTDSDGNFFPGLSTYSTGEANVIKSYNGQNTARLLINGVKATTIDGVDYTGPVYPLWKLSEGIDKIGVLPTEIVIGNSNGSIDMFNITKRQSVSLPKDYTLSDFIQDMYYGSFGVSAGLDSSPFYGLSDIIDHVMYGGITGEASPLTDKQYKGLIDLTLEINKIGTLPSGSLLNKSTFTDVLYSSAQGTDNPVYPNSMAELVEQIYGSSSSNQPGLVNILITGFPHNGGLPINSTHIGFLPAMSLAETASSKATTAQTTANTAKETANAAKSTAQANAAKIGTLPDGYETVGAALSAIKGIAEEAKAAALAAIPDPKTEGSNGKYVLTVDIVGDNATYRWEPIDRGDTTPTTE